jgi:phage-related protein
MTLSKHRLKESLGGVVSLLTINASGLTGNPLHIKRFVSLHGEGGLGVVYQGNSFEPHPYEVKKIKRSAKSNKAGGRVSLSDNDNYEFSRFLDDIGGKLEGATIYEIKVYERFLDGGVEPNVQAYSSRFTHEVSYLEQSDNDGELLIHTIDPLSRAIEIPSISFSTGIPNDTTSYINVFPAVSRDIAKGS